MAKKCSGNAEYNRLSIAELSDEKILHGMKKHADPSWWKEPHIRRENQAYLRRWGTMLRREARRRGLI